MTTGKYCYDGYFGLERETLRVDKNKRLAHTPHPFPDNENITKDFCENQIELVTPVFKTIDEVVDSLSELDSVCRKKLEENGESLWLYSNPPYIENEQEIPIATFTGIYSSKRDYREYLQRRYGKRLMLFSGIHFNFSFSEDFIREQSETGQKLSKDMLYMKLYKQLMTYSWLLVYLTSASPYYDCSFDSDGQSGIVKSRYASLRNSERGYWNQFIPILDHSSIQSFADSIQSLVDDEMLFSASELYLPVRLKPSGENDLAALRKNGIDHIELRMFDLDPTLINGVNKNDLEFAHLLILYLVSLPDIPFDKESQIKANRKHKNAALAEPPAEIIDEAAEILDKMSVYFAGDTKALNIIEYEKEKVNYRISDRINASDIY